MNKLFGFVACVTGLLIGGTAYGQCRTGFSYPSVPSSSYATPVVIKTDFGAVKEIVAIKEVVTPVAVPVIVPAFTFQYSPPCYAPPVVTVPGVPYAQPQGGYAPSPAAAPAGYTQPGYGQPPAAAPLASSNDKIRELAKALLEEMNKQADAQAAQQGRGGDSGPPVASGPLVPPASAGPPASGPLVPPAPAGPPATPPAQSNIPPGAPVTPLVTREQAAPYAIAAMQRNCAACHTGNASKGDFVLFSQPGIFNPQTSWRSAIREIDAGRMPPKSSQYRLTQEEAYYVRIWLGGL